MYNSTGQIQKSPATKIWIYLNYIKRVPDKHSSTVNSYILGGVVHDCYKRSETNISWVKKCSS